jgi:hypothetical protein
MKIDEQIIRNYTLTEANYQIKMSLTDNGNIEIRTYRDARAFIFDNLWNKKTLDKWDKVLTLMKKAVKLAREKLEVKNKGGNNNEQSTPNESRYKTSEKNS